LQKGIKKDTTKGTIKGAKDSVFTDAGTVARQDDNLEGEYSTRDVLERIWFEHFIPHKKHLVIAGIAMAVSAATTGAVPLIIKYAGEEIFVNKNQSVVMGVTIAAIIITICKTLAEYMSNVTVSYLGLRFVSDLRIKMFERLAHADLSWVEGTHSGRFVAGFLNDANLIRQTASRSLIALGENSLKVVVLLASMFWIDWRLASIVMALMPIGLLLLGQQRRKMRSSTKKSLQETGDLSALISQTLRSIRVVRAYGQEDKEIGRASSVINRTMEFTMRGARAKALANPIAELMTGIGFAGAIYYAGTGGLDGAETDQMGRFLGFMTAAMLIYQPLRSLATLQTTLQEGVAASSRVFGIIDRVIELKDEPGAKPLALNNGEIKFENVTFSYEPGQPVLENFSVTIPAGKTVALVGPSGSGKSTILNLVLRFFDPDSGRITIDGQGLREITIDSLRQKSALVTQDPVLFDDTIKANIAYGTKGASDEDIKTAANSAAANEFITDMPKGYMSNVGEAGNNLSGGERQRVAIARAILKNAPILLLDEPTSALDSHAERQVQAALEKLMQGQTVLMIAHRLSTIQSADIILVMKDGQLAEQGSHQELIDSNGIYASLCRSQFMGLE